MYKVTELFFARGLRVDQLHTDTKIAPFGGTVLFLMDGIICADRVRLHLCMLAGVIGRVLVVDMCGLASIPAVPN